MIGGKSSHFKCEYVSVLSFMLRVYSEMTLQIPIMRSFLSVAWKLTMVLVVATVPCSFDRCTTLAWITLSSRVMGSGVMVKLMTVLS